MAGSPDAHELDAIVGDYWHGEDYDSPQSMQEVVAEIDAWFQKDMEARSEYSTTWEFHYQYLKGKQLIARNRETNTIVRIAERDRHKLRSRLNILRPTARSLLGKMARSIPLCEVIPATADFEEQHGARVATALLKHGLRVEKLKRKYIEALECLLWSGNGFWYLEWDRFAGEERLWCEVCNFEATPKDVESPVCPQCAMQRQMELEQQAMMAEQAKAQAMQEVLMQLPPGTEPSPMMLPEDVPPPPMQQMGPLPVDQEVPELQKVFTGAPKVRVIDPRSVYPEAGAKSLEDAQRVTIRYPVSVSKLRQSYPEFARYIKADASLISDESLVQEGGGLAGESDKTYLEDQALLWVIIHKPTRRHPHGRILYRVGDIIVRELGIDVEAPLPLEQQDDNPIHILNRFPLYHIGFDHNTGEFWYESFIEQAWDRQQALNQVETQISEHTQLGLKPKALVPTGSRISVDEITSTTDQLIKYNPSAGEIKPFVFPPLSNQVYNRRDSLIDDIRVQATVTAQEAGVARADMSGRAAAILEAEADQQLGPMFIKIHDEWVELHRGYLQLYQVYGDAKTKFTITGSDAPETHYFDELILKPGWDIQIEQEDGLSQNRAVRLTQALDLANAGVFNDEMSGTLDKKALMRHARLNLHQAGYDLEATERSAAAQLPHFIMNGGQWQPQLEDDPERFGEVLLGWLRGPGRRLNATQPEVVQMIRQIWMFYTSWALTGAMPQLNQLGMNQQAGAGPGGPDMTASGGTPNSPGHVQSDASHMINEADKGAEMMAAVQTKHEG